MKKLNSLHWKNLIKVYSENTFRIIKLATLLFMVTVLNVFGSNTFLKNTNPNPDKATDPAAIMQQNKVTGTVTDKNGPIPGANVVVTGTTVGVMTDIAGKYSISVPVESKSLTFSFVGMEPQEVSIGTLTQINVTMSESAVGLNEVIIVGYGTQKKINVTGSISSIGSDQLDKRIVTQASQLLQGVASGVTSIQGSGKPGQDESSLTIRGLGTFSGAGNDPLVIIDGVPGSINSVNPNNIESISVLKDAASSAIYGSRAANGVIFIKTKEGKKGKAQISYDAYIGIQKPPKLPQYVDSWTYAEMYNEASANIGKGIKYTQEDINKFKSGEDPDNYPNKHHLNDLFNSGSGLQTKHNLTFSGGTEKTQYLFSIGYLKQNGNIDRNNYDRYDMLLNINTQLRDNLKLNVKISGNQSLAEEPAMIRENYVYGVDEVISAGALINSTIPGKKSDGTYGVYEGYMYPAEAALASESFGETRKEYITSSAFLEWNIIKDLKLTGEINYQLDYSKSKLFGANLIIDPTLTIGPSQLQEDLSNNRYLNSVLLIDYDKTFGNNFLHVLGGFSQEINNNIVIGGFRDDFPSNTVPELNAGSSARVANYGNSSEWKLRSYFGRVNYRFQEKYLLEGNVRYDGSSRFYKNNRYGFFPSVSAAWIISNEDFFDIPWIKSLKIRGSYGILGNQQIGTYPYQKVLNLGQNYVLGETDQLKPGIQLRTLPFQNITWETTKISDGGVDINLFEGKINIVADYYYKNTSNILYYLTVANILGMDVSNQNAGKVENKGWDFELTHKNTLGNFSYSIKTNFSINHNKVLSLAGVERDIDQGLFVGYPLTSIYGYETDGLFVDQADIDNYPTQNYPVKPGYPRYKDISGPDGVPDGKVTAQYDRTVIGNSFPKYTYGMGIMANYKGFDFYTQLEGLGGWEKEMTGKQLAFYNNGNIEQWQADNHWTEANPDPNAAYPRLELLGSGGASPWGDNLTTWLQDASFIRIKMVQLGYNIPSKFLNKIAIDQFRIYFQGQNIKCFDNFYPGWDPEMVRAGGYQMTFYPPARLWILGISVKF